ncbi:MAG: Uma2 family endonuclease, partial [Desulfobacterales bacterium]|nr:Uma2 family endonuclease [Desulfobacterales bacterium]
MAHAARKEKIYTYEDYLGWPPNERWEIIHGVAYNMAAAPSRFHQQVAWELAGQIRDFLKGAGGCKGYFAPFTVRLPGADEADADITDVAEPDIVVICDPTKLDDEGCRGAPDFIVEILSPSTSLRDHGIKLGMYERHGVKEYWIIDPIHKVVTVRRLGDDGKYGMPLIYAEKGKLEVLTLPGLIVDLDAV